MLSWRMRLSKCGRSKGKVNICHFDIDLRRIKVVQFLLVEYRNPEMPLFLSF